MSKHADSKNPPSPQTQLFNSVMLGDLDGIKAALAAGANPNAPRTQCATADFGYTPLTYPYIKGVPHTIRALIEGGADANGPDALGTLPLAAALKRKDTNAFSALITAGADPTRIIDREGGSVLHHAARSKNPDYIYFSRAFNMNARDQRGRTPLMNAVENGDLRMVQEIVRSGADITIPDRSGATPQRQAETRNQPLIAQYLKAEADNRERQNLKDRVLNLEEEMFDLKKLLQVSSARRPPPRAPRQK